MQIVDDRDVFNMNSGKEPSLTAIIYPTHSLD